MRQLHQYICLYAQVTLDILAFETKSSIDEHGQVHQYMWSWQYIIYEQKNCILGDTTLAHIFVKFENFYRNM